MTAWRARLAALRAEHAAANSAKSVNSSPEVPITGPIGTIGAIGIGTDGAGAPDRAAFLARAAEDAAAALAAPDPGLAHERAEIAAAQAAEARGEYGRPKPEADHRAALAGFLAAGRQRPPAWADPTSLPPPGAWCSCCGRFSRTGGRWWREAANPSGWRCATCHPPAHLAPGAVVTVET